jgi:hypothetical protein
MLLTQLAKIVLMFKHDYWRRAGRSGYRIRCELDFQLPSRLALGPTQPPVQWVPDLFPGVKRPGRAVDHPSISSAEVKERVEPYLYSPSGPSWSVVG